MDSTQEGRRPWECFTRQTTTCGTVFPLSPPKTHIPRPARSIHDEYDDWEWLREGRNKAGCRPWECITRQTTSPILSSPRSPPKILLLLRLPAAVTRARRAKIHDARHPRPYSLHGKVRPANTLANKYDTTREAISLASCTYLPATTAIDIHHRKQEEPLGARSKETLCVGRQR